MKGKTNMPEQKAEQQNDKAVEALIKALNEDLAREYQAIIAYVVYSNVLKGAQWMKISDELKLHAAQELQHALIVADQIDYLGGMPTAPPKEVKLSDNPEDMIRFDLDNETETIKKYRERVKQAEALGHFALAENLRKIIMSFGKGPNGICVPTTLSRIVFHHPPAVKLRGDAHSFT